MCRVVQWMNWRYVRWMRRRKGIVVEISRDEAVEIARRECQQQGWPWKGTIQVCIWVSEYCVVVDARRGGRHRRIFVDVRDGQVPRMPSVGPYIFLPMAHVDTLYWLLQQGTQSLKAVMAGKVSPAHLSDFYRGDGALLIGKVVGSLTECLNVHMPGDLEVLAICPRSELLRKFRYRRPYYDGNLPEVLECLEVCPDQITMYGYGQVDGLNYQAPDGDLVEWCGMDPSRPRSTIRELVGPRLGDLGVASLEEAWDRPLAEIREPQG